MLQKVPVAKEEDEPEEEDEEEMGHAETYAEYMPIKCTCFFFKKIPPNLLIITQIQGLDPPDCFCKQKDTPHTPSMTFLPLPLTLPQNAVLVVPPEQH